MSNSYYRKSKLRDDGIELENERYKGSKTSRRNLYEESDNGSGNESENSLSEESLQEDGNAEESDELSDESDSELESDLENEIENDNEPEALDDDKRKKLKAILNNEQKTLASQLSTIAQSEAEKGESIQHQMDIYESILDARIKIQKAVASSNSLPNSQDKRDKLNTEESEDKMDKVKNSLYKLLDQISDIRLEMMKKDGVNIEGVKLSKKRSLESAFGNADQLSRKLVPYRDVVLTKWSKKIQAASGASALNQSKFSIQNQNAQLQVATNLADMERLVKRTRINRSNYTVLGEEEEQNDDSEAEGKDAKKKASQNVDARLQERRDIFDDTDFYRMLLKDLVDRRMADAGTTNSLKWTNVNQKIKKNVDTKASKGRKLRYHVHEKIQNFDAPREVIQWNDDQIE